MYAVIKTGGKQYRIKEGDVLEIERLKAETGQKITFDQVLLIEESDQVLIGTPFVANAVVGAEVIDSFKGEKILIFKKKRRKQYRRTKGHRQELSRVRIEKIYSDKIFAPLEGIRVEKPAEKATAPKASAVRTAVETAKKPARKQASLEKKVHKPAEAKAPAKKKAAPVKRAPAKPAAKQKKGGKE